jgi:hypothetical protein
MGALVNTVMNFRVPQNVRKLLSSCTTGGFTRRLRSTKLVSSYGYLATGPDEADLVVMKPHVIIK